MLSNKMSYEDGQNACRKLHGNIVEFDERYDYESKLEDIKSKCIQPIIRHSGQQDHFRKICLRNFIKYDMDNFYAEFKKYCHNKITQFEVV